VVLIAVAVRAAAVEIAGAVAREAVAVPEVPGRDSSASKC
jgi:ABC-type enterobactin transport system permease subunit